jgi:hypothetical protein
MSNKIIVLLNKNSLENCKLKTNSRKIMIITQKKAKIIYFKIKK